MGWQEKLNQSAQAKIEEQWPKVQQLFQEKVGLAAVAAAKSDDAMRTCFKTVYEALPLPLRLAVKEDVFMEFCFSHREKLPPAEVEEHDHLLPSTREQKIRRRAYEIYLERGAEPGRDLEDWLQAEREYTTDLDARLTRHLDASPLPPNSI